MPRSHVRPFALAIGVAFVPLLLASGPGCSDPPPPDPGDPGGSSSNGGSSSGASSSGASGVGGTGVTGGSTGVGVTGATSVGGGTSTGGDSGLGDAEVCAGEVKGAKLAPLNIYVQLDRSHSMVLNPDGTSSQKGPTTRAAFTTFFQDPATANLRVALRLFPNGNGFNTGCNQTDCSTDACANPHVPIGTLMEASAANGDTQEAALVARISNEQFTDDGGGTPLYPALDGALKWAKGYATANPADKTVVILVTDGEPQGCMENRTVTDIANLAEAARLSPQNILTYAIGLPGSNPGTIDLIAQKGGTADTSGKGIYIESQDVSAQLNAELQEIRTTQVPCFFDIPTATDEIDPTKVNVKFTPGGGATVVVGKVATINECDAERGGWYYDNDAAPTRIILCAATCSKAQDDVLATIGVEFGCPTEILIPDG